MFIAWKGWIMIGQSESGKALWIGRLFACRRGIEVKGRTGFCLGFKGLRLKVWRNGKITRFYKSNGGS
jgi:hypothetical protein